MTVNRELDQFLESVERRAFVKARLATGNEQEALDIVQDTMLKLVKSYRNRPRDEWGPLFQRILQSRITDWYRRQSVKNRLFVWFTRSIETEPGETVDEPGDLPDRTGTEPAAELEGKRLQSELQNALQRLPLRQQQAFVLRQWDGLSVEETARAMGCSTGSVKTHCSRAVASLKQTLQALGFDTQTIT